VIAMSGEHELKDLLRREIAEDTKKRNRLREQLNAIEPRLTQAVRFYRLRFGEEPFPEQPGPELPKEPRRRRRLSHADHAAVAITESSQLGVPLKVDEIRRLVVSAGFGRDDYPTRETLVSTLFRSPLFERAGRGLFVLREPYKREDLPSSHSASLMGVAGSEETPGSIPVEQGSEAAPISADEL
jgi:hypothetical protein